MKKVIVIGCPGSGKSHFAKALHAVTGLPLVHLDRLYWNADRTNVEREVFLARLADVLCEREWIIDGNYGSTMERRMQACDTIVFLDYPTEVCLAGVRERRGKPRSDMPWTETEEDDAFIAFIQRFREDGRKQILELLERYADREIYVFRARSEADDFLRRLRRSTGMGTEQA